MSSRTSKPSRKVDAESGFNRTRPGKKPAHQPPPSDHEEEVDSNSDLESELEMPVKDDSRRRGKVAQKASKAPSRDNRRKIITGRQADDTLASDKEEETSSSVAPHMMLMLGAAFHLAIGSISQPSVSHFIPSCGNMFWMLNDMAALLADNTLLHEMYPGYVSISLYLYYSHVYFYQVLRAREAAGHGILSRIERRVLTLYKQVGPPESWPIAAPMIGFISSIGAYKSENPMFSWIVPSLPDFSTNHAGTARAPTYGLTGLNEVVSSSRVPLVPAFQEFLKNIGASVANFTEGVLYPKTDITLAAANTFCGIAGSTATDAAFQSLAFNESWNAAFESDSINGQIEFSTKRKVIRRWNVPQVVATTELTNLQSWLGLQDTNEHEWMKHLLVTSSMVNRFFPGSTTLAEISPLTTLGRLTVVKYDVATARAAADDKWYHTRHNWKLTSYGYTNTDQGIIDTKIGIISGARAEYSNNTFPALARQVSPAYAGPFFVDQNAADHELKESFISESATSVDPVRRFAELLSSYFDESAGRAKK
uniref:Capsid protein n=1 Tax=Lentinula edodes partitivirus 4 TaxID=2992855 RepID=A0A9E7V864_9VIRU|nr:capsid protein [Lentinula edodes partitivirus 4]